MQGEDHGRVGERIERERGRERETEGFFEYLEEEENKKKKAKTEGTIGKSNQAATPPIGKN